MKRHALLIPLSHDHHHTLALCLRLLRPASGVNQAEIEAHLHELEHHFQAEENQFAPLWDKLNRPDLRQRFETDHQTLRQLTANPQWHSAQWNNQLAHALREHIRFEERELFIAIGQILSRQAT